MSRKIENIRNIGIIAHIDAGKTTATENMLFVSGANHNRGNVDKGTTQTDDDAEEQDRGITIYSACMTFNWKTAVINLLDTPGHVDFTAEVERCLRVLDGAVVIFSAREGVEAQSETVWRQADRYKVPRIIFINKMDREGANFDAVLKQIKTRLAASNPIPIQIPVGEGPAHFDNPFRGIIDLIEMKMLTFADEGKSVKSSAIPEEYQDQAEYFRAEMIEALSDFDDELMELAMEGEDVPKKLLKRVLREVTLARKIQPLLCGSALHGIGVPPILDCVRDFLPSPIDRPPVEGFNPVKTNLEETRKPDAKEPFCGLVFKILPAKTGDYYWIRVYSGTLKANTRVSVPGRDKKENVAQLWQIRATKKDREGQISEVLAGDIVGVIGPRFSVTGDTFCDTKSLIQLESIDFPDPVIEMAIEPESTAERNKLAEILEMLKRQDPTFKAKENEDTGQTLISGMGELHLEVIRNRLLRDFNLNVKVHKPRVSYRETVENAAIVVGECHRMVAGQQLFAKLELKMEPDPNQSEVTILNQIPFGVLTEEITEAIMSELNGRAEGGGAIGSFPLTKLRITVLNAEVNEEQSNEMAFSIAAGEAFEAALQKAVPQLLEPIMKLNISTPDEYYGDIANDLSQRRARIVNTDNRDGITFIEAHAPLGELFEYTSALRSISQGRAAPSMEPLEYEPAPPQVANVFAI